jgi:hypothetical protein
MKRVLMVVLFIFLFCSSADAASWKTTDDEDTGIDGTEILMLENGAGTDNNWATLVTIKNWIASFFGTAATLDAGTAITNVVQVIDDGDSNSVIPFAPVIDASGFDGNLDSTITDIDKLAKAVDELTVTSGSGAVIAMPLYSNTGECDSAGEAGTKAYDSTKILDCRGTYGWYDLIAGAAWVNEASEPTFTYYGYPNTDGVPSSNPVSTMTVNASKVVTSFITATADGTAVSVNIYIASVTPTLITNVVLYKYDGGTYQRIGYGNVVTPAVSSWQGEVALTAYTGQSLSYSSGDILYFGMETNGAGNIGRNDAGGVGAYYVGNQGWVSSTDGIGATPSLTLSDSRQIGAILKVLE